MIDKTSFQSDLNYSGNKTYSALSIDVEDGVNILMRDMFNIDMPPTARVIDNVKILLDLFNESRVKATFFILGEIASAYPSLVREIASNGHELGVHGYYHNQLFRLTPATFREELHKAKALIEEVIGNQVYGFRAPAFSVMEITKWSLAIISELDFKYDSSIVPAKGKRYGWPGINKEIHRLILPGGNTLIEVPLSVINFFGRTIPACGGGYLRYFPYYFTRRAFRVIQEHRPVIVYLHPYELDAGRYPEFFYESKATLSLRKRLRLNLYRLNKDTVERKLGCLVKEFQFKPIIEIINDFEKGSEIPVRHL